MKTRLPGYGILLLPEVTQWVGLAFRRGSAFYFKCQLFGQVMSLHAAPGPSPLYHMTINVIGITYFVFGAHAHVYERILSTVAICIRACFNFLFKLLNKDAASIEHERWNTSCAFSGPPCPPSHSQLFSIREKNKSCFINSSWLCYLAGL